MNAIWFRHGGVKSLNAYSPRGDYHPDYAREWQRGFRAAIVDAVGAMKRRRPELQAAA